MSRQTTGIQDKQVEIVVGERTPEDGWLEDPQVRLVKKTHLELLQLVQSPGQLVLDAGCGPGTYGILIAEAGNNVVGIEISRELALVANARAARKGIGFAPMVGDLENLPIQDNTFDVCFCGWVLHHFPDMDTAVAELNRVLKPGGRIAIVEPNESNIVMTVSRFVEDLSLIRNWVLKAGWDTSNRTVHRHKCYVESLQRQGFTDIKLSSCYPGGLPPIPIEREGTDLHPLSKLFIRSLLKLRVFLFRASVKILSPPLNGADLLVMGVKNS